MFYLRGLQDQGILRVGLLSLKACLKHEVFTPSLRALLPWASTAAQGTLFEVLAPVAVLWRRAVLLSKLKLKLQSNVRATMCSCPPSPACLLPS
jgi:hypothetical protein